jgi:ribosome-binding protein aMBF1 (putative translation factor)
MARSKPPPPMVRASEPMSDVGARFGATVRRLREERGWSQEYLAELAALNRSYMGEVERAVATPSLTVAERLARALELRLSALIARCESAAEA